jgi:hypothetical protein
MAIIPNLSNIGAEDFGRSDLRECDEALDILASVGVEWGRPGVYRSGKIKILLCYFVLIKGVAAYFGPAMIVHEEFLSGGPDRG